MKAAAALAALLAGCVANSHEADVPGSHVLGSPEDVHTAAGDYVGYRVVRPCSVAGADLGVRGTGSVVPTQAMILAAGRELLQLVGDLRLPGGGGYGFACEPGFGTELMLGDWRDVDTAIARVGPWLAERDLALQVGILVAVAVAD
ncbi:MAG TPA: hypothetical protein VF488_05780 [Gemmatimonadaceae bacterium]